MGIIINIIVGGLIGWLASILAKTNDQMGCIWNIVIGVVGAAIGNWIATLLFGEIEFGTFNIIGLLISIGGAVLLILLLKMLGVMKK